MSFSLNVPPSVLSKMAKGGEGAVPEGAPTGEIPPGEASEAEPVATSSKKREDWKKLKELEEARKAGTAPAMQDEHGKDINPHIPQYIMQAPWYFGALQPTLSHQRQQAEKMKPDTDMYAWYKKGIQEGSGATKYRKGACENCGAITHKRKDCLERPRKIGARFTGTEIAPDEHLQPNLEFDYESKRDRWNGYDTNEHKKIFEEYARIEEAKKELKSNQLDQSMQKERDEEDADEKKVGDDDEEDEDKYADDVDMPGQKFETKQRITVRNLRIREDTAKYLYNLDTNSAYYDPKTRSMRDNPFGKQGKDPTEIKYAGDNFVRWSGDAHDMATQQMFAWEAYEKGQEVHLQADPTKLELLTKEYNDRKDQYKQNSKQSILDKYGGEEHLDAPSKQLLLAQTEDYIEYSRHGRVIKGQEKAVVKSIYEEDVYINNHSSVWGSYWNEGRWGYRCCHAFIKESYCTGEAGKDAQQVNLLEVEGGHATEDEEAEVQEKSEEEEEEEPKSLVQQHLEQLEKERKKKKKREKKKKRKHKKKKKRKSSSSSDSESSEEEDEDAAKEKRIQEAMKKLEQRDKEMTKLMAMDERKRPYNVMYNLEAPSEEVMEAFRRKRAREEDPMTQFF